METKSKGIRVHLECQIVCLVSNNPAAAMLEQKNHHQQSAVKCVSHILSSQAIHHIHDPTTVNDEIIAMEERKARHCEIRHCRPSATERDQASRLQRTS